MCLTCPLSRCRYEVPGGLRALLNEYRDQQIGELRQAGASVNSLAARFGLNRRTVSRALANYRGQLASESPATGQPSPRSE